MLVRINKTSEEPLFLQIRAQIIAAIAPQEITAGEALPSVRSLASDLGINLHTVNKAYAVLRDEGYVVIRGRSGAVVAEPVADSSSGKSEEAAASMEESLYRLALAHRARGGTALEFEASSRNAVEQAYREEKT